MYGFSFNTTVGDISLQGEIAYRPNMPLQVDTQDLTFHALGPMLSRCHDPGPLGIGTCTGTAGGLSDVDNVNYGPSDFIPYPGVTAYDDTFDLAIGAAVGSARSFPNFIGAYRGVAAGETPPNSYIRGCSKSARSSCRTCPAPTCCRSSRPARTTTPAPAPTAA
jgi:hypothetical protein